MAHEPYEEASWSKHGKENIAWRDVGGGKELRVRCFHVRYFVHRGCRWGMARLLVGAFTGPRRLIPIVTLQVPLKVQACRFTRGLALTFMPIEMHLCKPGFSVVYNEGELKV
jgi:hypothetical protein